MVKLNFVIYSITACMINESLTVLVRLVGKENLKEAMKCAKRQGKRDRECFFKTKLTIESFDGFGAK